MLATGLNLFLVNLSLSYGENMGAFSLLYRIWYLNRGPSLFRVWRNNGKQKKQYHSVVMRPSFSLVYGCRGKVNVSCFTDTFSSRPMCDLSICWWDWMGWKLFSLSLCLDSLVRYVPIMGDLVPAFSNLCIDPFILSDRSPTI